MQLLNKATREAEQKENIERNRKNKMDRQEKKEGSPLRSEELSSSTRPAGTGGGMWGEELRTLVQRLLSQSGKHQWHRAPLRHPFMPARFAGVPSQGLKQV